jgi:hypothetical protein
VATSHDMEDMKLMLTNHALVVIEVGALYLSSVEELKRSSSTTFYVDELKEVIFHNFGFRKYEFHAYCSFPEPFILIFSYRHARGCGLCSWSCD